MAGDTSQLSHLYHAMWNIHVTTNLELRASFPYCMR